MSLRRSLSAQYDRRPGAAGNRRRYDARRGAKVPHATIKHAHYLERSDRNGVVTAQQYLSCGLPFEFGYDVPAGYTADPIVVRATLEFAARAKVSKGHLLDFLVESRKLRSQT